jgi:hypothetical protein
LDVIKDRVDLAQLDAPSIAELLQQELLHLLGTLVLLFGDDLPILRKIL